MAGLAGGLASGFTSSLTRSREDTLDYRVILDRSATSLERDLPLAIERIRAAGFAPIFLIDELDKLEGGKDGIETTMRELIFRMKQLTTDYGFFCFLVDRAYFDRVQAIVEREAYAIEHSFFSERLYVLPAPPDLETYVLSLFEADPPRASGKERANPFVVAKHLVHQSKLNMLDLIRQLDATDDFERDSLLGGVRYRLTAAIQTAVEQILLEPELFARAWQDISFRQLLIDVLYIISRAWERDELEVKLGDDDVAARLMERMYRTDKSSQNAYLGDQPDAKTPNSSAADLEARIGKRDADLLTGAVRRLARILCEVDDLNRVFAENISLNSDSPLKISERIDPALLLESSDSGDEKAPPTWIYKFQYDQFGRQLTDQEGIRLDEAEIDNAGRLVNCFILFQDPGFAAGVPIDILIGAGLWPADLTASIALAACLRARNVSDTLYGYSGFSRDKKLLARVRDVFDQNLSAMGALLHLAFDLERDASIDSATALQRISMVLDFRKILQDSLSESPTSLIAVSNLPAGPSVPRPTREDIDKNPITIANWFQGFRGEVSSRPQHLSDPGGTWMRCSSRLSHLFNLPNASLSAAPLDYDDLIVVAKNMLPARLLRRDLATPDSVSAADWSLFALEALTTLTGLATPPGDQSTLVVPAWMAIPALFALGFGPTLLNAIAARIKDQASTSAGTLPDDALRLLDELPAMASESTPQGILYVFAGEGPLTDPTPKLPGRTPVFLMRASHISRYDTARSLLTELKAFQGVFDERTE